MDVGTVLSVAQTLLASLQCSEVKEILSIFDYKSQLDNLQCTVSTINAVFRDAETKQELTHEAQHWIEDLKDAVFDADDLFDEFVTLAEQKQLVEAGGSLSKKLSHFFSRSHNPFSVAYRMSRRVKDIKKKLDAIATNCQQFGFKIDSERIRKRRHETCSYVNEVDIIGREDDLNHIVDKLLASNNQHDVSVLTIVGIGGLGKTALTQLVYNDSRVTSAFPLRLWTCVADEDQKELDVKEILCKILGRDHKGSTMEQVQSQLREQLAGKKFLLVLDDVWTEKREQWCELVKYLIGSERGSWIMVTTRSQMTATITGGSMYELKGLSEENSWHLFKSTSFTSHQSSNPHEELVKIGREIVDGCARVPLAIRVAGSLLFGQDVSRWKSFQKIGLANIRHSENGIMPILKLSFHHLETPLKSCFCYCALFPKDFVMEKEMLISLWMAQGYIVPLDKGQSIEDAAEEYFLILLRRCFFQDIQKDEFGEIFSFKIHDLMHDVAQSVSGKEMFYVTNTLCGKLDKKVRHLSQLSPCIQDDGKYSSSQTHLRSHLFLRNYIIEVDQFSVEAFIAKHRCLRVMDLHGLNVKSLPGSIGNFLHLRYLDLSYNLKLEVIPKSITKLYNLQTLNISRCGILKELPRDLSRLLKLRALDITNCRCLTFMPWGMGNLSCLERLSDFKVGGEESSSSCWKQWLDGIEDLRPLNNLKGDLRITIRWPKNAKKVVKEDGRREGSYLRSKEHLNHIALNFIHTEGGERMDDHEGTTISVMEELQPHSNLKHLKLCGYHGVRIPDWITLLPNLVKLHLKSCQEMEYLLCLGNLRHLKLLSLKNFAKLEYIEEQDSPNSAGSSSKMPMPGLGSIAKKQYFYPSLERLAFDDLPKLRGWRRGMEDSSSSKLQLQQLLPCLSQLIIRSCPELTCSLFCPKVELLTLFGFNKELQITNTLKLGEVGPSSSSALASTTWCYETEDPSTENLASRSCNVPVPRLKKVQINNVAWLNALSKEGCQFLVRLKINGDKEVTNLPNWMQFMTALQTLEIGICKGLTAMPNWMPKLTSLRKLIVYGCSESLERRCQKDPPGEDLALHSTHPHH